MQNKPPRIDERDYERIMKELRALAPHYVPELDVSEDESAGVALLKIFANMHKLVIERLNKVPEKNFVAFLDMLGVRLLPAQSARVPVTFHLSEGTAENVLVPKETQIAAGEVVFETEENVVATPSKLVETYSVGADEDGIFEPPPNIVKGEAALSVSSTLEFRAGAEERILALHDVSGLEKGDLLKLWCDKSAVYAKVSEVSDTKVTIENKLGRACDANTPVEKVTRLELFKGRNIQEHILYLGHDDLFNIKEKATIKIIISRLGDSNTVQWEYWGEAVMTDDTEEIKETDWHPLNILQKSQDSQELGLQKETSGEIKRCEINGIESRWIRCRTLNVTEVRDVLLDTIRIGSQLSGQVVSQFYTLPTTAIREIGTVFGERLAQGGVNTVGELLKFKDNASELAEILSGKDKTFKCSRERAENILENAQKRIMDKGYEEDIEDVVTEGILPDMTFCNDVPLDLTLGDTQNFKTPVYPFGKTPRVYDTFYIASQDCFSKKGTEINIAFSLSRCGQPGADGIMLSWEYWDGKGWKVIKNLADGSNFTKSEEIIKFTCPGDMELNQVNGQENYWMRVRIVNGDYGKEEFIRDPDSVIETWKIDRSQIIPPIIKKLAITYTISPKNLQHCLTYNNLEFKDVTEESKTKNKSFKPFQPLDDLHRSLYICFDKKIEKGPISILISLEDQDYGENIPKIEWYYYSQDKRWVRLEVSDNTKNLTTTGTVKFIVPDDFSETSLFGTEGYWLKAVDIEDKFQTQSPEVKGVHLNTTFAIQAERIEDEILGSSDGATDQEFEFTKIPVIAEEIWIDEGALFDEEKNMITVELGEDSVLNNMDETGFWVRWPAVEDFFDSKAESRHYVVDRATGEVKFGDGVNGMVPPIGRDNIKASYLFGGGKTGNVEAYEVSTLKTPIAYVDKVANPWSAGGGADVELVEDAMERGPWVVKHRDRAVTIEDFEWLARQASRDVARTKCMKEATGMEVGSVTVIILPKSGEDKPAPSFELENVVEKYLSERCSNVVALRVNGPVYIEVSVSLDVYPVSIDMAAVAENETLDRLKSFLHPLTGGTDGGGWEFGRLVCISDIYSLMEGIAEIDHVERVDARMFETGQGRRVTVAPDANIPDALVCSGEHQVTIKLEGVA
ncbi:MAG: putative baseplate assembly protein [Candidatus Methanospirareceae archaeon]